MEESVSRSPVVKNPGQKKKIILLILVVVLLAVGLFFGVKSYFKKPGPALTQSSGQISTPNTPASPSANLSLKVDIQSTDSGKIKGVITVTGADNSNFTDLYYDLALNATKTSNIDIPVSPNSKQTTKAIVTVSAGPITLLELPLPANRSASFEIAYSAHVATGINQITANLVSKEGTILTSTVQNVNLKGTNNMLSIDQLSCKVVVNGVEYDPHIAPPANPGQNVVGRCSATNPSSSPLTVKYQTEYAILAVQGYPLSQKSTQVSQESVSFAPGETKVVSFNLPSLSAPQVYSSMVGFVDSQNQPQSILVPFRWTVSGPSARIESISLDKDYYRSGEKASVNVAVDPSMDLFWRNNPVYGGVNTHSGTDLPDAELQVSIYDQNNQLCGNSHESLPNVAAIDALGTRSMTVAISRNCLSPKAVVSVNNDGQELAKMEKQVFTKAKKTTLSQFIYPLAILLGTALIVAVIIFLLTKKKTPPPPQVLIVLMIIGVSCAVLLSSQQAAAYTSASGGINQSRNVPLGGSNSVHVQSDSKLYNCLNCSGGGRLTCGMNASYSVMDATAYVGAPTDNGTTLSFPISFTGSVSGGCGNTNPAGTIAVNNYTWLGPGYPLPISATYTVSKWGLASFNVDFIAQLLGDNHTNSTDGLTVYYNNGTVTPSRGANYLAACQRGTDIGQETSWSPPPACSDPSPSSQCANAGYYDNYGNYCTNGTVPPSCPDGVNPVCGGSCYTACTVPAPSAVCAGPYTDSRGYSCTGTKDCTPPTVSVSGFPPPGKTCLTAADLATNLASAVAIDPGSGASGIAWVHFFVNDLTAGSTSAALGSSFSGGLYKTDIRNASPSLISGHLYTVSAQAADNAGNVSAVSAPSSRFNYDANQCVAPFLQTTGGDVHSNGGINTPGGP